MNYPGGTWECDANAPWNAPDQWEGRTCCECRHFRTVSSGLAFVCVEDSDDIVVVKPEDDACEGFEL